MMRKLFAMMALCAVALLSSEVQAGGRSYSRTETRVSAGGRVQSSATVTRSRSFTPAPVASSQTFSRSYSFQSNSQIAPVQPAAKPAVAAVNAAIGTEGFSKCPNCGMWIDNATGMHVSPDPASQQMAAQNEVAPAGGVAPKKEYLPPAAAPAKGPAASNTDVILDDVAPGSTIKVYEPDGTVKSTGPVPALPAERPVKSLDLKPSA